MAPRPLVILKFAFDFANTTSSSSHLPPNLPPDMKLYLTSSSALVASLAVLQLASRLPVASAKPSFVARIPNGANVPDVPAVGHADPEGSTRETNVFGDDFEKAGKKWTVALCQMDSDGDGQTNGQELGDPCCEWTATAPVVRWSDGVSDPGVKTKTSSAALLASASCSGASPSPVAASASPSAAPASTPTTSKPTTSSNSSSASSSSSSPSAAPSASIPTASTANSTATADSTKPMVTTPKPTTVPTSTPAATSVSAPGFSLGFSTVTLLAALALSAIAAIRD